MAIENRKARFDYEILDTYVAGISLEGWEVKSIRAGSANLKSAWVVVRNGEAFLDNFSISPWKFSREIQLEKRSRKLLLHKKELKKLETKSNERGNTIIPLKIFDYKGHLKCELAVARGKKKYEKRQVLKNRSMERVVRQTLKNFNS
jgi:SsrA-binding protein